MPTYDYECDACGYKFEEMQSFSEPVLKKCPKCKKNKLRRLLGTGAAILFKGSGFYQTDYRSDSYHSAAKADQTTPTGDKGDKSDKLAAESGKSDAAGTTGTSGTADAKPTPPAKSSGKKNKS